MPSARTGKKKTVAKRQTPKSKRASKNTARKDMKRVKRSPTAGGSAGKAPSDDGQPVGAENLDKVRDILFGAQVREQDKQFKRIDERISKETTEMREEMRRRFDSLEQYMKSELESLVASLKDERTQRVDADKELGAKLTDATKTLDGKIGDLAGKLSETERTLRQQILEQSKTLRDELQQSNQSLSEALDNAVGELRDEKTDRGALADMLTEVALRLKGEFDLPSA